MNPAYLAIAFGILVIILLLILIIRRPTGVGEEELKVLREERSELQRSLAVEEQKSQHRAERLAEAERALSERITLTDALSEAKTTAEKRFATAAEALSRVEISLTEAKERLTVAERSRDGLLLQLDATKADKSKLEENLATKTEALARNEVALEELRGRLIQTTGALDAARQELGETKTDLASVRETLGQERKQTDEKLALLAEAKERMAQDFKLLATDVLTSNSETFSKQNKEQIDVILTPLREKLGEFQLGLQTAHTESAKERATLAEQIRHLSEHSAKMTLETSNLTRALKGEAQTQGAWGEMILGSILERSGLREGEEYIIQQSHSNDEGHRLRPDVVVNLPGGQKIVVDSKLSLVAFNDHINADNEVERAVQLKRHLASIRSHIRTLSSKEYHAAVGSQLDYVVMFIPIEGALAVALQEDPSLTAEAVEANVAIATPTTLMIALRTVANVWQVERRNRNAETIAQRAGKIYDKLVGFIDDMTSLGSRLGQAQSSYAEAMSKLSSGKGNLTNQVAQLKELGAKVSKSIPSHLLDESDTETTSQTSGSS